MHHHKSKSHVCPLSAASALLLIGVVTACGSDASPGNASPAAVDGGSNDASASDESASEDSAGADTAVDSAIPSDASNVEAGVSCDEKAKNCAKEFGSVFTKANGRADGTLVAVVRPADSQCTASNGDHVVLQLSILGQVQRLVASVEGVAVATKSAPLLAPPYAEGWHTNAALDYPNDLGVHSTDFSSVSMAQAVAFICEHMTLGAPVSVFAYSDGSYPSSAHQIHYNDKYPDGAIVIDPTSATPTYLLFRYENQSF